MRLGDYERQWALRIFPDAALRLPARPLARIDDETARLAHFMVELMLSRGWVGLAANQIGLLQRLLVIAPDGQTPLCLINPVLEWESEERGSGEEGCLSLPGIYLPVERPLEVTVAARDLSGEERWYELSGPAARVVQHEIDHLDGRLIIDYVSAATLREARLRATGTQLKRS